MIRLLRGSFVEKIDLANMIIITNLSAPPYSKDNKTKIIKR